MHIDNPTCLFNIPALQHSDFGTYAARKRQNMAVEYILRSASLTSQIERRIRHESKPGLKKPHTPSSGPIPEIRCRDIRWIRDQYIAPRINGPFFRRY